ncbi:hypothetical protein FOZ62_002193, partial [Perkinsus olseni]
FFKAMEALHWRDSPTRTVISHKDQKSEESRDLALVKPLVSQPSSYCQQQDALIDGLTVQEHLTMYGVIRGVPLRMMKVHVKELMEILQQRQPRVIITLKNGIGN